MVLQRMEIGTDPTYKEWKPIKAEPENDEDVEHGSYLQGMETECVDPESLEC